MTQIDDAIRQALSAEDAKALEHYRDPSVLQQVLEAFRGVSLVEVRPSTGPPWSWINIRVTRGHRWELSCVRWEEQRSPRSQSRG